MAIDYFEKVLVLTLDRIIKLSIDTTINYLSDYAFGENSEELVHNNINKHDNWE